MTHGRHSRVRNHHWFASGTAAVLVLGLILVNWWWAASGEEAGERASAQPAPHHQHSDLAVTPSVSAVAEARTSEPAAPADEAADDATEDTVRDVLADCRTMHAGQREVLDAAERSLSQWRTHVDAMNQLVAGEITLDQANAFWARTRKGAAHRIAEFTAADGAYRSSGAHCSWAADELRPGDESELRECRHSTVARTDALDKARVAVATWSHHVHDMERLRAGTLSPERATQLWLKNWRNGVDQLDAYSQARQAADRTSC